MYGVQKILLEIHFKFKDMSSKQKDQDNTPGNDIDNDAPNWAVLGPILAVIAGLIIFAFLF